MLATGQHHPNYFLISVGFLPKRDCLAPNTALLGMHADTVPRGFRRCQRANAETNDGM